MQFHTGRASDAQSRRRFRRLRQSQSIVGPSPGRPTDEAWHCDSESGASRNLARKQQRKSPEVADAFGRGANARRAYERREARVRQGCGLWSAFRYRIRAISLTGRSTHVRPSHPRDGCSAHGNCNPHHTEAKKAKAVAGKAGPCATAQCEPVAGRRRGTKILDLQTRSAEEQLRGLLSARATLRTRTSGLRHFQHQARNSTQDQPTAQWPILLRFCRNGRASRTRASSPGRHSHTQDTRLRRVYFA